MLAHEHLSLAPDALALRRVLDVVSDLLHARVDVLVPGAVISLAQHVGEAGSSVSEIESSGEDHHPGAVGRVGASALGPIGIDAERNARARADRGKLFSLDGSSAPMKRLAPGFPPFAPHLEIVLLGDLEKESRARRIVAGADEADVRVKLLLRWNRLDVAVRRRWKEFRGQAQCSPLGIEARDEEGLRHLSDCDYVRDVGAIGALVPLRIVIPHRVGAAIEERPHRIEVESMALSEKDKIGIEPPRLRERPLLRQLATDHPVGALVIDHECLVAVSFQSALSALLHPPMLIAADYQDSQAVCGTSTLFADR